MVREWEISLVCVIQTILILSGCHRFVYSVQPCTAKCSYASLKVLRLKKKVSSPSHIFLIRANWKPKVLGVQWQEEIFPLFTWNRPCRLKMRIFFFTSFCHGKDIIILFKPKDVCFPYQVPLDKEAEHLSTSQRSWGVGEHRVKNKESQSDSFMSPAVSFPYSRHRYGSGKVTDVILSKALIWFHLYTTQRYGNPWVPVCLFSQTPITSTASIHQRLSSCLQEPLGTFTLCKWWTTKAPVIQNELL